MLHGFRCGHGKPRALFVARRQPGARKHPRHDARIVCERMITTPALERARRAGAAENLRVQRLEAAEASRRAIGVSGGDGGVAAAAWRAVAVRRKTFPENAPVVFPSLNTTWPFTHTA